MPINRSPTRSLARQLRSNPTPAEQVMWSVLRNRQFLALKFRRQHPIGPYIADFFCPGKKLIIELDGESHPAKEAYDAARTAWLIQQGYQVVRFSNPEVLEDLDGVISQLTELCQDGNKILPLT